MPDSTPNKTTLREIKLEDISDVAAFLHSHMSDRFSTGTWEKTLSPRWPNKASNSGFMLKDSDGKVVGAICALYSEQSINGEIEQLCNLHSWAVLPEYRKKSIMLVLAAIRQQGFHFTMFTPNKSGLEIFSYLKFKPLNDTVTPLPHIPLPTLSRVKILEPLEYTTANFSDNERRIFKDHSSFPWIHHTVFESEGESGFILYRKIRYKRLPSTKILFISNKRLFFKCWPRIRIHLLFQHGLFASVIESRFLDNEAPFSLPSYPGQNTFFFSDQLSASDIECLYSELMILDL